MFSFNRTRRLILGSVLAAAVAPALSQDYPSRPIHFIVPYSAGGSTGQLARLIQQPLSEVLGQKNVKLYPGSMVAWSQDARALPMSNVPGRGKQLLIDTKLWAEKTFK